ncbi:hypothetical protein V8C37DRAFT_388438 [Trichoderma ceciliae]
MRIQKTFTIVPPPGPATRTPADNRPMTSKQVRKAYRAANSVPRVSRAELLRQERAEQERIRKEFEKEKAAAKAKALREKKRAKEQAEREEKKKKGLPTVTVRPSQDTIAWFVRGNGSGNKRDCKGGDVDEITDAAKASALATVEEQEEEEDEDFPSPKRFCNKEEHDEDNDGEAEKGRGGSALGHEEPCTKLDAAPEKNETTTEDDFLEGFEIMSDEEISKLSFNDAVTKKNVGSTEECSERQSPPEQDVVPVEGNHNTHSFDETTLHKLNSAISVKNPELIALQELDLIFDDEDDLELEMLALDVVMTSQQRLIKENIEEPLLQRSQRSTRTATGYEVDLGLAAGLRKETPRAAGSMKHDQTSLMPPPPISAASRPISPVATKPQSPPLSTQQIFFNMDDFFPTSSQQAAELEEEETIFISQPTKPGLIPKATAQAQAPSPAPQKELLPANTLSSSPGAPKPFFTSSGSNERMAVALLRSRRTAEQEEERRQRALHLEAIEFEEAEEEEVERRAREKRLADSKLKRQAADSAALKTAPHQKGLAPQPTKPVASVSPSFSARKGLAANSNHTPTKAITQRTPMQRTPLVETNAKVVLFDTKSPVEAHMAKKAPSLDVNLLRPLSSSLTSTNANKTLPLEAKTESSSPKPLKTPVKVSNKENMASPEFSETEYPMASQESEFGGSWMDELATELSL